MEAGTISLLDLAIHDYLNLKANLVIGNRSTLPAGVCLTSAVAIHALCQDQFSERTIQRSLEHLEKIGWIKRWNVRGKRGNYPTLICRGSVHDVSGNEYRVNGEETIDWRNPKYVPVGDLSADTPKSVLNVSGDREVRSKRVFSGGNLAVTEKQDALVAGRFPWVDRKSEYRKADEWIGNHRDRAPRSVTRFLHNWFSRIDRPKTPIAITKPSEIPDLVGAEWKR